MVTLEKIQSNLFSNLYESFLIDDDPLSGEAEWRNVFDYRWEKEEDHCGYALLDDDGDVVGMLGMVFSERLIAGETRRFCNLHTWWVREDHRGRSLSLLRPMQRLKGYTITHFTPCDTVRAVARRLGFQDLDSQVRILLPMGLSRATRSVQDKIVLGEDDIVDRISSRDRKILLDHRPYDCGHLLVRGKNRHSYVLYTHVVRHRMPYCHIHYMSDKEIFVQNESLIRATLLKLHKSSFVVLDNRLVRNLHFPYSFKFWAPAHALYKSSEVQPHQIDNLYSDVVFLKLTTLPDMSHAFGQLVRKLTLRP